MAYVRRDKKRGRDSEATYLSIAHNVREKRGVKKKRPKPVVFTQLGREEDVDAEIAEAAAAAMNTFLELRWQIEQKRNPQAKRADVVEMAAQEFRLPSRQNQVRILTSREFGFRYVLEPVWEELGLKAAFERYESERRLKFPLERLVFGLVLNRLVDPKSKRACNEWLEREAYFPEWDGWDVQHIYRALDVLHEHWGEVEQELFCAL